MQTLRDKNEVLKYFLNIIQYNSMLNLLPSANRKRRFAHYFDARNYSSATQRKGSRETYCFISVYHDVGQCSVPQGEREQGCALTVWKGEANR